MENQINEFYGGFRNQIFMTLYDRLNCNDVSISSFRIVLLDFENYLKNKDSP